VHNAVLGGNLLAIGNGGGGFLIPWNCLKDYDISPTKNVYAKPGQRKTFAQALGTTCDIPLFELPIAKSFFLSRGFGIYKCGR